MTVVLFIVVLVLLILVHEFGHFVVAKLSGMRVDEFGIGYPPRVWGKKMGETIYSVNALPFGGFVRIYGEDESNPEILGSERAFSARPKIAQALTLVAGVAMNLLLAYVLITATLLMDAPRALSDEEIPRATDVRLAITDVMPGSPADQAGLKAGDTIRAVRSGASASSKVMDAGTPEAFVSFVAADPEGWPLQLALERDGDQMTISATPAAGVIASDPSRLALGVSVTSIGVVPETLLGAPIDGARFTWNATKQTAIGLATFLGQAITLRANLAEVSGPVGIAGAVGNAYAHGLASLLSIAAIISINLAIINLLPIPVLDGGRLLFVIIESIIRRPIKPSVAATVNSIGFLLLLLLMVIVTGSDIWKLVH